MISAQLTGFRTKPAASEHFACIVSTPAGGRFADDATRRLRPLAADLVAAEGIRALSRSLPVVVRQPDNLDL